MHNLAAELRPTVAINFLLASYVRMKITTQILITLLVIETNAEVDSEPSDEDSQAAGYQPETSENESDNDNASERVFVHQ